MSTLAKFVQLQNRFSLTFLLTISSNRTPGQNLFAEHECFNRQELTPILFYALKPCLN